MKYISIIFGTVISVAAIASVMAISTPANAGEPEVGVTPDKLQWVPFGEGPAQLAILWGDMKGDEFAIQLKLPPGWTPGPHSHSADYHGVTRDPSGNLGAHLRR